MGTSVAPNLQVDQVPLAVWVTGAGPEASRRRGGGEPIRHETSGWFRRCGRAREQLVDVTPLVLVPVPLASWVPRGAVALARESGRAGSVEAEVADAMGVRHFVESTAAMPIAPSPQAGIVLPLDHPEVAVAGHHSGEVFS